MNSLFKSINTLSLNPNLSHPFKPTTTTFRPCRRPTPPTIASNHPASTSEIDMVPNKDGIFTAKPKKVIILWDLDNKPPRGPPYDAALSLINVASHFGDVIDISAYANRHTFIHLPHWVRDERRDQRRQDLLERQGAVTPSQPYYICSVCGRKCKTNFDLKKHFKQLHVKEREKKLNRMRSLKGKKRQRFKERFVSNNHKYMEAARSLLTPKVGYGLADELRRAGVFVKTVEDKPQAADWALKRQMQHSMSRGIDWLVLVSDDSDFVEMLKRAKGANLGTVVVGDWDRALGREADLWVEWCRVENGEVTEDELVVRRRNGNVGFDDVLDELVSERSDFYRSKMSMFSEGEEKDDDDESDYFSDSDDDEEDDWYI